ncbi:HPr kinase/phosphorylase [Thalassococcus sp. BH17M4-6]|uniref:HPr kinase/phosphorylase n=1 Tax=Thalassococcus sp. BH17M4-6 TaxID=3413148 RepID=UPI003BDF00CD
MAAPHILHASAVAVKARAALIIGASGSGKSSLALEMMSRGAVLVADDRVVLTAEPQGIILSAPDSIRGLIEARGLGILRAEVCASARLCCVVDLDQAEPERLPPERHTCLLGQTVPLLHNAAHASFPAALVQYLRGGRSDR